MTGRALRFRSLAIPLILFATTLSVPAQEVLPSPPVFDGRDGLQPPLRLSHSNIVETSKPTPGYPLWVASEGWHGRTRYVTIHRTRFATRKEAMDSILSSRTIGKSSSQAADGRWDSTPVAGQISLSIPARTVGTDILMFVMDKEFVFIDYAHPALESPTSMGRLQAIAKAVETNILARNESGANEPERDSEPPALTCH